MGEIRTITGTNILTRTEWNALMDHPLEKPFSYIVRKNGSNFEAIHGKGSNQAGKIFTDDADATEVIQACLDEGAGFPDAAKPLKIHLQGFDNTTDYYELTTKLTVKGGAGGGVGGTILEGEGFNSRLKVDTDIILIDTTGIAVDNTIIKNLKLEGLTTGSPTEPLIKMSDGKGKVMGCWLKGGGYGIYCANAQLLFDNFITQSKVAGIYHEGAGSVVSNVISSMDGVGLKTNSHNAKYKGNHIITTGGGMTFEKQSSVADSQATGNFFRDGKSFAIKVLAGSHGNQISGANYFAANGSDGLSEIIIEDADYTQVVGNYFILTRNQEYYCVDIATGASATQVVANFMRKQTALADYINDLGSSTMDTANQKVLG